MLIAYIALEGKFCMYIYMYMYTVHGESPSRIASIDPSIQSALTKKPPTLEKHVTTRSTTPALLP
jgi:hypothetical protein